MKIITVLQLFLKVSLISTFRVYNMSSPNIPATFNLKQFTDSLKQIPQQNPSAVSECEAVFQLQATGLVQTFAGNYLMGYVNPIPEQTYDFSICNYYQATNTSFNLVFDVIIENIAVNQQVVMCGPQSCSDQELNTIARDINSSLSQMLSMINIKPPQGQIYFYRSYYIRHLNGWLFLPIFLGLLIFLGTIIDFYPQFYDKQLTHEKISIEKEKNGYEQLLTKKPLQEEFQDEISLLNNAEIDEGNLGTLMKFFLCFSLKRNLLKLIDERHQAGEHQNFNMFNGVIFVSVCWIVLTHGYIIRLAYAQNPEYIPIMLQHQFFPQIVQGGDWGLDTCFMITGFLLTYFIIQRFQKIREIKSPLTMISTITYSLFTRIVQIWPLLAVSLVINWQLIQYMMPRGPYAKQFLEGVSKNCGNDWWKKLLFVENWTGCEPESSCIGWSWYVAISVQQLFILTPILFIYTRVKKSIGFSLVSFMWLLAFIGPLTVAICNKFKTPVIMRTIEGQNANYNTRFYNQFWCRSGPYFQGVLYCCLYLEYCKDKKRFKAVKKLCKNYIVKILFPLISLTGIFLLVWCLYVNDKHPIDFWTQGQHVTFLTFSRDAFCLCTAFAIFPDFMTKSGPLYEILSNFIFAPLYRVAFLLYLLHICVIYANVESIKQYITLNNPNLVYLYIADLIYSLILSAVVYLMVEEPIISFQRKFLNLKIKK